MGNKGSVLRAGALAHATSYMPEEEPTDSPSALIPAALSPRAATRTQRGVDYEFGKAFGRQDADKYFGGMISKPTPCTPCLCTHAESLLIFYSDEVSLSCACLYRNAVQVLLAVRIPVHRAAATAFLPTQA